MVRQLNTFERGTGTDVPSILPARIVESISSTFCGEFAIADSPRPNKTIDGHFDEESFQQHLRRPIPHITPSLSSKLSSSSARGRDGDGFEAALASAASVRARVLASPNRGHVDRSAGRLRTRTEGAMAERSEAGGRAAAEGPSLPSPQKPSAALPYSTFVCPVHGDTGPDYSAACGEQVSAGSTRAGSRRGRKQAVRHCRGRASVQAV